MNVANLIYTETVAFLTRLSARYARLLAEPVARMMENMAADEALTPDERRMLTHALYRGFSRRMDGQTEWLRQELDRRGVSMDGALD